MSETMFQCACGFRCVESQIAKTEGVCPKESCKKVRKDMAAKYGVN